MPFPKSSFFFCRFYFADTTEVKKLPIMTQFDRKNNGFHISAHQAWNQAWIFQLRRCTVNWNPFCSNIPLFWALAFLRDVSPIFRSKYHLSYSLPDIRHSQFWITISKEPIGLSRLCLLGIFFILRAISGPIRINKAKYNPGFGIHKTKPVLLVEYKKKSNHHASW